MKNLRDELRQMRFELNLIQKVYSSKEEEKQYSKLKKEKQQLPEGVLSDDTGFYRYIESDLTREELESFFLYRQVLYLKSIRSSMLFFVVLTVISLFITLVFAFR
ncbi:hypothetical protein IZU99_04500 [Oscillospiraceae bacterium CM]|nr:hypothetical protein IZU99_04500 [Oscillospiraceae bacterium CM]